MKRSFWIRSPLPPLQFQRLLSSLPFSSFSFQELFLLPLTTPSFYLLPPLLFIFAFPPPLTLLIISFIPALYRSTSLRASLRPSPLLRITSMPILRMLSLAAEFSSEAPSKKRSCSSSNPSASYRCSSALRWRYKLTFSYSFSFPPPPRSLFLRPHFLLFFFLDMLSFFFLPLATSSLPPFSFFSSSFSSGE